MHMRTLLHIKVIQIFGRIFARFFRDKKEFVTSALCVLRGIVCSSFTVSFHHVQHHVHSSEDEHAVDLVCPGDVDSTIHAIHVFLFSTDQL